MTGREAEGFRAQDDRDPVPESPHLDALQLDAVRAGEATPAEVAHVRACETCRHAVAGLEALAMDLKEAVSPQPGGAPKPVWGWPTAPPITRG